MTIWKYAIQVEDSFAIEMPESGEVLTVQTQQGWPCIWVVVDPAKPKTKRRFFVRGTGHEMGLAESASYVGTFQMDSGALIFHLFDAGDE